MASSNKTVSRHCRQWRAFTNLCRQHWMKVVKLLSSVRCQLVSIGSVLAVHKVNCAPRKLRRHVIINRAKKSVHDQSEVVATVADVCSGDLVTFVPHSCMVARILRIAITTAQVRMIIAPTILQWLICSPRITESQIKTKTTSKYRMTAAMPAFSSWNPRVRNIWPPKVQIPVPTIALQSRNVEGM